MTISGSEKIPTAQIPTPMWSRSECTQDKVQTKVVEKFISVFRDVESRKANYKNDQINLKTGFWYSNDYFKSLKECGQKPRIDFFKSNGSFFNGFPPKGFDRVLDPIQLGGKRPYGYILKRGGIPSEALKSVRESLCFIDCQEAIQIAYYESLLDIWGEEVFNQRFGWEGGTPLALDLDTGKTPLRLWMSDEVYKATNNSFYRSLRLGDEVFFRNVPLYKAKQPHGEANGFHCLCKPEGDLKKFIAFGIAEEGITEDQMMELFAREFNAEPIESAELYSAELIAKIEQTASPIPPEVKAGLAMQLTAEMIKNTHLQHPDLVGMMPVIRRLDAKKIQNLIS